MVAISPHTLACDEIIQDLTAPELEVSYCRDESHLRELWQIDKLAYEDNSLEFEPFLHWWQRYPYGSNNILANGRIAASIGIYPIGAEQAKGFAAGELSETDLQPVALAECEATGVGAWYMSGLVVVPEWRGRNLAKRILQVGLGAWEACNHLRYPIQLYGLAQGESGTRMLQWFGMNLLRSGDELPDGLDLYRLEIKSAADMRTHMSRRGI